MPVSAAAMSPLEMVAEETGAETGVTAAAAWMAASAEFWLCPKAASAEAVSTAKEAGETTTGWLEQSRR